MHELNPQAVMRGYGQELNPESYAICKADMLIKGQDVSNIKLGNTLSNDQLYADKFDYMLSNPPFGVDWKKIEKDIKDENTLKGFDGRFGPGLPRVSDGSLLFLLHLISKLRDVQGSASAAGARKAGAADTSKGGTRIGIILNGSPLFTGGAGSGESEIRRYILEADLLEAIIALPNDMFYNTGIATYVWVLSNKKAKQRKGKVQLINGVHLCGKMRKSLGSKRNVMDENDIATITRSFGAFEVVEAQPLDKPTEQKSNRGRQSANPKAETLKTFSSKIFSTHEFGYRRITIERPLRESYQFSDERIAELRFASKPLNAAMKWIYEKFAHAADKHAVEKTRTVENAWKDELDCEHYGVLTEYAVEIRAYIKSHFSGLKEKQIKDLLDSNTWHKQKQILLKAKQLQQVIGEAQHDDMNDYDDVIKAACKKTGITLDTSEKKQLINAVSWKNPDAEKVIKKIHRSSSASMPPLHTGRPDHKGKANPVYGLFEVDAENNKKVVIEYKSDGDLRDHENVALDPSKSVNDINEAYFAKEVLPHVPDAWIDTSKKDAKDQEIGIVGYEIPFNRHFYVYQPPRDLVVIDADLDVVSANIMNLLKEVHS